MGISFFYKGHFHHRDDSHLMRGSSIIRGDQIANFLGAKTNPTEGYKDDICIYVKPYINKQTDFLFEGIPYVDVIDGWALRFQLNKRPDVSVISCSDYSTEVLRDHLPKSKIVTIPQHHCNFERATRPYGEIKTVGMIGTKKAAEFLPDSIRESLSDRGIKFIHYTTFSRRSDIVNFYKTIDLQIVWRPYSHVLQNPLKIVNASAFGVPTIAYDERAFQMEVGGCYIPVSTPEEWVEEFDHIRSSEGLYQRYSRQCLERAENYHIEKIAELYKQLT